MVSKIVSTVNVSEIYKVDENGCLLLQGVYPFKLPDLPKDKNKIFNHDKPIKDQKWVRPGAPKNFNSLTKLKQEKWIEEESARCFETGAWVYIKGIPIWFPPAYWFTLNWWYMTDGYLDFRYNQLLEEYFEIFCENDPWCIATFRFKKRRDGLTTRRMARTVWKSIQTRNGWFGVQSKTGNDAKKVCWKILMTGFKKMPTIFLPELSGTTDPKTILEFKKPSTRITKSNKQDLFSSDIFRDTEDDGDLNTTIDWRDTTEDAYDGQQASEITLDEFGKWKKASALNALYTYIKSCTLDDEKYGMIHAITSPPETDGQGLKDCQEVWDSSDYTKIKDVQTWKIYRWFSSGLDSYSGAIDEYGFCDRAVAKAKILQQRAMAPEKKKKAVIRQTPMYIDEIFDSMDNDVFLTAPEMKARKKFLEQIKFKDENKKEPKYIFGNFDWHNGIADTKVIFKPSSDQSDFSWNGRWAISYMPTAGGTGNTCRTKLIKGKINFLPPMSSEYVIGVDPYDFRRTDSAKPSFGSAVIGKCFDFYDKGGVNDIAGLYDFRPDPAVFYEDMIKAAYFFGAHVNSESRNMKIFDHFEDRGYFEYMLPKNIFDPKKREIKGTPTTQPVIQEICTLIEAFAGTSLEQIWFEMLLEDIGDFDPQNTQIFNKTMAFGHMLLGFEKRRRFLKLKGAKHDQNAETLAEAISDNFT